MSAKKQLEKMMNPEGMTRDDAIYLATAGSIGMVTLIRLEIMYDQIKTESSEQQRQKNIDSLVAFAVKASKLPGVPNLTKGDAEKDPVVQWLRSKHGGYNSTTSGEPDIMMHAWYGAIALSVAGGAYWLMQHPDTASQIVKSTGEFASASVTAIGDVLEDAVDWMPF